ncbi:hypothetical protein ACWN8V_11910 [Vagococcus elongatus]|uniref:Uncharacterized protein n=1 Tax=Vagococcus elongatus TaxID=180344 RepID=A0A430B3V8_9ENTE|nr:hypothetical protein [Vagococcus elongatus]RSU15036.1 hypothetical protein CBF29_01470 [Vagococcus elongatus]
MKLIKMLGVLVVLCSVTGCSPGKKAVDKKTSPSSFQKIGKKEISSTSNEADWEVEAQAAAEKVLNAVIKRDTYSFKSVGNKKYEYFVEEVIDKFVAERVTDYEPEEDWTLVQNSRVKLLPADVLKNFKLTQIYNIVPEIKDFDIERVKIKGNEATVSFKSKAIANKDIENILTLIRETVGLEELLEGKTHDNEVQKFSQYINSYLYWLAFEKDSLAIPVTKEKEEFQLELTREADNFIIDDQQFNDLINSFFVKKNIEETGNDEEDEIDIDELKEVNDMV